MSKERAVRRAAREAEAAIVRAERQRVAARRAKRREITRRLRPRVPKRGRVGKLYPRRSRAQRSAIVVLFGLAVLVVWLTVGDLSTRIALTIVLLIALPAIVVMALGRR